MNLIQTLNDIIQLLKIYDSIDGKFPFYVYAFERIDGSIYVGQTSLLPRRFIEHYANNNMPSKLLILEGFPTRKEAVNREYALMKKIAPIEYDKQYRKKYKKQGI